jgi:NAD(P)-dependent dehydrogenase (short-subunit alcohol dehydrogenase family)
MNACRQIDIVVANAGLQTTSFWKDTLDANGYLQEPDWSVIDTNLKGIMATVKLALHYFQKNIVPGGKCVIVGSPDGYLRGSKRSGPNAEYVATEHGVNPQPFPLVTSARSLTFRSSAFSEHHRTSSPPINRRYQP